MVDFLYFDLWQGYAWPHFNLADVAIVVGVVVLLVDMLAREAVSRGIDADESRR